MGRYGGFIFEVDAIWIFVQNADYIHALEGGASMAATGATGIAGGNYQIFEKFIVESGANVYLDTPVGFFWLLRWNRG